MKCFLSIPFFFLYTIVIAQVPLRQGNSELRGDIGVPVLPDASNSGVKVAGYYKQDSKYGFVNPEGIRQAAIYNKINYNSNGFIIQKDNLYGIADKKGQVLGNIEYDSVGTANETAYIVRKNGKYGIISNDGNKVLSIKYSKILLTTNFVSFIQSANGNIQMIFNENEKAFAEPIAYAAIYANLVIIKANGKFGVVKKELVMPLSYDSIFVSGTQINTYNRRLKPAVKRYSAIDKSNIYRKVILLTIQKDNKYGLTDSEGAVIFPADNDAVFNQDSYRYYTVKKGNLYGIYFIDGKKKTEIEFDKVYADGIGYVMANKEQKGGVFNLQGKQIVPFEYDPEFIMQYHFGFGVKKNKKKGIVGKDGLVLVPPIYDDVETFYENGLSEFVKVKSDGKSGVVNLKGELIIPIAFDWIGGDKGLLKVVTPGRKFGLYDKTGKVVIPPEYQWIIDSNTENSNIIVIKKDDNTYNFLNNNTRQIILNENVSGYGYVQNQDGLLNPFSSSGMHLLFVKGKDGKLGMLNEVTGVMDIPMIYDNIMQRSDGGKHSYFSVKKGTKYGLTDESNRQVIPLQYNAISIDLMSADDGQRSDPANAIVAAKGKKFGTVNFENQTLIPFQYTDLQRISASGLYKAKVGNYYQVINAKNEVINKGPFDEVANFEALDVLTSPGMQTVQALTFYKGMMKVIDDKGKFITSEVAMLPHNGYKTFDELKLALINALDSKDDALLKDFAVKVAPSEHILFYLTKNPFTKQALQNTDVNAIQEMYYNDLLKFKLSRWNRTSGNTYNRASLTEVTDYTIYQDGLVTNSRRTDPTFGDTRFMEKLLRNALKVNGYWISSYFMQR